jgi:hypothetical protein
MTTQTTITIRNGEVHTTMASPRVGRPLSRNESAALHAITALSAAGLRVHYESNPLTALATRILDPEDLGHAVTHEVRLAARHALGMPVVEGGAS